MNVTTEKITHIEFTEEETKTLYDAYNVVYDLAHTVKNEYGKGLIGSHYNDFSYDELETTYRILAHLFESADDDTFKVI